MALQCVSPAVRSVAQSDEVQDGADRDDPAESEDAAEIRVDEAAGDKAQECAEEEHGRDDVVDLPD